MRHLVIGQRQKAPNFSAFHWSPHGCLITTGQHFVTTRVVHLPKRTETSLITESDQSGPNHQLLQLCTARTAWSDSDQAVRTVHSCISWFPVYSEYVDVFNFPFFLKIDPVLQEQIFRVSNYSSFLIFSELRGKSIFISCKAQNIGVNTRARLFKTNDVVS